MRETTLFLLIFSALIACDPNENNSYPQISSTPFTVGTEWNYSTLSIMKIFESEESDKVVSVDSVFGSITVKIIKDTILNDTMSVRIFENHNITYLGGVVGITNSYLYNYKYIDGTGLKNYAYRTDGTNLYSKYQFLKRGIVNNTLKSTKEIIYYSNPLLEIELPLTEESSWVYIQPTESMNFQVNKKVIGSEYINIKNQNIFCYKVKSESIIDSLPDEYTLTDWISEYGLIKSQSVSNRLTLLFAEGDSSINIQTTETVLLKDFSIK